MQCNRQQKQFTEVAASEAGITFRNDILETQHTNILTYEYTYNGAGIASGDINNDGLSDLYFSGNSVSNRLYINKGDWRFEDITEPSGTGGRKDWKTGVTMADVNGDGWLDIYVCYSGNAPGEGYNLPVVKDYPNRANQLFINKGCQPGGVPAFTESAKEYGLDATGTFSTQAYFFDFDVDGDLDMFLVNHANMFYSAFFNTRRLRNLRHPYFGNKLYRNDGKNFTDISASSGIHGSGLNFGLSAAISDFNMDGWPDIYVTNDYEEQDFCYINNHDGTFREESHKIFSHLSKFGMGSDVGDLNNDGLQELIVLDMLPEDNKRQKLLKGPDEYDRYTVAVDSGYHHQYMRNTLHLNRGFASDSLPRYSEVGQSFGMSNTDWSWSPFLVDLDNDGFKDVFITNGYLRDFTNLDFMKYTSTVYQDAKNANKQVDYLSIIQQLPQTRLTSYFFKNEKGIALTNVSQAWGLSRSTVSNGAIYADLDNDGDYDLVTNNLNDSPTLLRNNANELQNNSFIKIRLKGISQNTYGSGAKIYVTTDSSKLFSEATFTRGYGSSVEPVLTIGLGKANKIRGVEVQWPGGSVSTVKDVPVNTSITVIQPESQTRHFERENNPNPVVLRDVTKDSGIDFRHKENSFIDFKGQRLLYYQPSRLGGKLAVGDVNRDGNDDVFFGGASGQPGKLFLGSDNGTFRESVGQPWSADAASEDIDALFFDADADSDPDLYVVSGGSEFITGAPLYQDRLYINDGSGNFIKAEQALPVESISGGSVSAADFDHDGDQDLFIGGRHTPSNYPLIPRSVVLENNSKGGVIKFTDATSRVCADLSTVGMVTGAVWTDFNNDSWDDLLVVGEWMPVMVFENKMGKLVARTDIKDLENSNGWWCSISVADVDGDGDKDYFLGNAGTNTQFRASPDQPIRMYAGDFNSDQVIDPLIFYYIGGKSWPLASRDELLDQVSTLRKKFIKYEDYSNAAIDDILSDEQQEKSYKFSAYRLESCWLENIDGKTLKMRTLPSMAQISPVNAVLSLPPGSGHTTGFLLGGNFYPYKPQLGRSDASFGLILNYDNHDLKVNGGMLSNVWLTGDIRDMEFVRFKAGATKIIASRNNDTPLLFELVK